MVINELLKKGVALIEGLNYGNPILESILILSKLLGVDKSYIYTYGDREVAAEIEDKFMDLIKKRSSSYPIQYLLKEKEFMGLLFYVEEGVLIPRPDTEVLVEYVIDKIKTKYGNQDLNILDIGVGSGAIALSIANYCPNTKVYGVDLYAKPIEISNINKEKFNLNNVEFFQGDLFKPIEEGLPGISFNIIISNPPYIGREEIENLQRDVKDYEPRTALDGGDDGLDFYRRISHEAKDYLSEDGILFYEIGYKQGLDVKEILKRQGYSNIEIVKDLQGHDRVVYGILKERRN